VLTTDAFEALSNVFDGTRVETLWRRYAAQCFSRRTSSGEWSVYSGESAEAVFNDGSFIDPLLNRRFFQAVPGIVTGFGLLVTFVAILAALMQVHIGSTGQVEGLQGLIGGLSGKFVSSIAALLSATVYVLLETPVLHGLTSDRIRLVNAIDSSVPRLTVAQVLTEISRDVAEQSSAFRSFNTDLSVKLRQSMSESMGPTLIRMAESIEGLNELLRSAEANRQQALSASLQAMTERLEQSITELMSKLGAQFSTSLSGAAMNEFSTVTQSLGNTGQLLEQMNVRFQSTQTALEGLIKNAQTSAVEQMALGRSQVEELTNVLRSLMVQMNESAGRSVAEMSMTLTTVVKELTTRVGGLSEQLALKVAEVGDRSTLAATQVVDRAEHWSRNTASRLEELLDTHRDQLSHITDARTALDEALSQFRAGLGDYASVSRELRGVLAESNALASAAISSTSALKDANETNVRAAAVTASHVQALQTAARHQEEAVRLLLADLQKYREIFTQVDTEAGKLLSNIGQQLRNYTQMTQEGANSLVAAANDHFGNAALKLKDSVETLDEYLQELTEVLSRSGLKPGS
jgi:hypothetical protein